MMSILKMIYSPHFKDKLLSIDKIINHNPKDYYIELTIDKLSMLLTWRSITLDTLFIPDTMILAWKEN